MTESLIATSGLGTSSALDVASVALAAARLIPAARLPRTLEAPERPREQRACMGPMSLSSMEGHYLDREWTYATVSHETPLIAAFSAVGERRFADPITVQQPEDLTAHFLDARSQGLRAVCMLGAGFPWSVQEQLQLEGAVVGRLPFATPEDVRTYASRLVMREREAVSLPRKAWLVSAGADPFILYLLRLFVIALREAFARHGFAVTIVGSNDPAPGGEPPGFIVLLTHGSDGPDYGTPLGLSQPVRRAIGNACEAGAIVLHLGCNGAGAMGGGRFENLPAALGLNAPVSTIDTFEAFAANCLAEGASGVIAHVDSTWSAAFEHPQPVIDLVDWLASGRGTFGHAMDSIWTEALRTGARAHVALRRGDDQRAGISWLRHLDLKGFVLLGDPSAYVAWR
jgi:hypothetical protein